VLVVAEVDELLADDEEAVVAYFPVSLLPLFPQMLSRFSSVSFWLFEFPDVLLLVLTPLSPPVKVNAGRLHEHWK